MTATNYGSGTWAGPASLTTTGDLQTATIALFGDSIGRAATGPIRTALEAKGHTLYTYTWSGQNTQGLVDALTALPQLPARVIMEAGTNDLFQPPLMAAQIERAKAHVALLGRELFWVDTFGARTDQPAAVQLHDVRNTGWVNQQIHAAIDPEHVIGWNAAIGAAVGRGRATSYYLQDGVHPWPSAGGGHGDGCAFFAAVVAARIPPQ